MKKTILTISILFLNFIMFAKGEPDWFLDKNTVYPKSKYLCETGSGATEDSAKSAALTALVNYIKSDVETLTQAESRITNDDGDVTRSQSINQAVTVTSKLTLSGVEYTKPFYEKKRKLYHVACYIEKEKLLTQNETVLYKYKKQITTKMDQAKEYLKSKNPMEAYFSLKEAEKISDEYFACYYINLSLNAKRTEQKFEEFNNEVFLLDVEQDKCIKQAAIYIDVKGDFENMVSSTIATCIKKNGLAITKDKKSARYFMVCNIEKNLTGGGEDVYGASPDLNIELKFDNEVLFSYLKEYNPEDKKILSYDLKKIEKNCAQKAIEMINDGFEQKFKDFISK